MTWRLGVVGSPISHSLSPVLHAAGLAACGLEGGSARVELELGRSASLRDLLPRRFDALSVTAPLKRAACELADEVDDVVARTGSANSLLWRDDRLLARSTDGDGFVDALRHHFSSTPSGGHAVVLGAGGAASAIVEALIRHDAASVVVHGRSEARVADLVRRYPRVYDYSLVYRPVDLIVNTIPIDSRSDDAAVLQGVNTATLVVDIAYSPLETPWMTLHAALGCSVANGLAMLAFQAARQMQWWFERDVNGLDLLARLS